PRVRLLRVGRLLLDARVVPERDLVHGIGAPVRPGRVDARADRGDHDGAVARADDRVLRLRREVREVPGAQAPLLTLDDQQRLAGEHEEVLLVGLPVVHAHRLAGLEDVEVEAELRKGLPLLEVGELAAAGAVAPARLARVQDEPAVALRRKSVLGLDQLRLRDHAGKLTTGHLPRSGMAGVCPQTCPEQAWKLCRKRVNLSTASWTTTRRSRTSCRWRSPRSGCCSSWTRPRCSSRTRACRPASCTT